MKARAIAIEYEEQTLIRDLKDPQTKNMAFHRLVKLYERKLYNHIRRMLVDHADTDDVLQQVFIKAWQNIEGFRAEAKLGTWLYKIATNETLSFLRKKKRFLFLPIKDITHELEQKLYQQNDIDADALQLVLQKAILTLPEKQRIVFNLKYFEEMKYEEMAEVLSTSVGALKASYHHAVKKIEAYISKQNLVL